MIVEAFAQLQQQVLQLQQPRGRMHDLLRHKHSSTLPTAEEQVTLPLHSKPVPVIDPDRLRARMSPSQRDRWDELWRLLTTPPATPETHVPPGTFSVAHATKMVDDGIITRLTTADLHARPTKAGGIAFTVKEEKDEHFRLRAIYWPKRLNDAVRRVYTARMNLRHVASYLDRVRDECAAIGDLSISFYQVEIPSWARAWFRFTDARGTLYEMNRLPMGFCPSAEIMQLLTETLAGCPHAVATPQLASHHTSPDVWIDGFRVAGARPAVTAALRKIVEAARDINATFKEPPTVAVRYDFIGVHNNHTQHTVRVADKTRKKLPRKMRDHMKVTQLATLTSRLIFAGAVVRAPLARFYFALKWTNRLVSAINNSPAHEDVDVTIPRGLKAIFNNWLKAARSTHTLPPTTQPRDAERDILYTDASSHGHGAVLFLASGEIAITGGAWPASTDTSPGNMAALEAASARIGVATFADRLLMRRNFEHRIDNTSAQSALARGIARAASVNEQVAPILEWVRSNDVTYTVSRVDTDHNWADKPSRGQRLTRAEVLPPSTYESRGAGSRVARSG